MSLSNFLRCIYTHEKDEVILLYLFSPPPICCWLFVPTFSHQRCADGFALQQFVHGDFHQIGYERVYGQAVAHRLRKHWEIASAKGAVWSSYRLGDQQ